MPLSFPHVKEKKASQMKNQKGKSLLAYDAVIFDIDNVLVDTRHSYLDAIRWTIEIYLTDDKIPLFSASAKRPSPTLLSPEDVDDFKLLGGFNDDWDCCYGLLVYLLTLPVAKRTLANLKQTMKLKEFIARIKNRPLGVSGIVKMLGRPKSVTIEKISRIFQEVYLGNDLFSSMEGKRPLYWKKRGLIHRERLVFKKKILERLKRMGLQLAIATGRPRFEAHYVLERFGILDLFDVLTPIDEVKRAERELKQSLRKPHPYSLLETAKKIGGKKRLLYVGDLPDDILATHRAKGSLEIRSVAFPVLARNPRTALAEIVKVQPDFIIRNPRDLFTILQPSTGRRPARRR